MVAGWVVCSVCFGWVVYCDVVACGCGVGLLDIVFDVLCLIVLF